MTRSKDEAVQFAGFRVRMLSMGLNPSGTPGKIDAGWGAAIEESLAISGYEIVEKPRDQVGLDNAIESINESFGARRS